jgi:hypothetical protein
MIKKGLLTLILLGSIHLVFGQDRLPESGPDLVIKNGTSSLFNPVLSSINLGLEYYIPGGFSIHIEGGPAIKYRLLTTKPDFKRLSGYRLSAAIRKYFRPVSFDHTEYFVEVYGSLFNMDATIAGDFWRRNEFGIYEQRIDYDMDRNRAGIYGNFGFQSIESRGFTIELGMGIGALWMQNRFSGAPDDATFLTNGSLFFEYDNYLEYGNWILAPLIYINMGYALSFQ